jgi:hypothetical protein
VVTKNQAQQLKKKYLLLKFKIFKKAILTNNEKNKPKF